MYAAVIFLMYNKLSLVSGLAIATLVVAFLVTGGQLGKALAQNVSSNQATNQSTTMNQTAPQATNQTAANQTATKQPKLTTSDIQDIRKSLEDVRKQIADGKAVDALKSINDIDQKLLVAMSANPPPMLEKSSEGNK